MATTAEGCRRFALAGLACGAVALGALAGCGATDQAKVSGAQVYGDFLNVYSSLPLSGPQRDAGNEMLNGERLALAERGGKVGQFTVDLVSLNSLADNNPDPSNGQVALNARKAVVDPRSIAYIGDFDRSQTRLSKVIVGQAQLLQVAPSSGWASIPGGRRQAPGFREAYRRQFGSAPGDDALYGYAAMGAVLDAIARVGSEGGNRFAVADAFRAGPAD